MTRFAVIALLLVNLSVVTAQDSVTPLRFEVASVKPLPEAVSDLYRNLRYRLLPGGGFQGTLSLEYLIGIAYQMMPLERIVGEPSWVRTQRFEVDAKPSGTATDAERLAMLRTLLEERFGLVGRKDPDGRQTVYTLVMANDSQRLGPGIRPAEPECVKGGGQAQPVSARRLQVGQPVPCGLFNSAPEGISAGGNLPFQTIVTAVWLSLGEEVIDRTGLKGNFDFYLELPSRGQTVDQQDVSIFTVVREQLGLKLQREEITREVFIVEKVSQPTPN
jgi:uncharacterized protein (TIGR03435 family)